MVTVTVLFVECATTDPDISVNDTGPLSLFTSTSPSTPTTLMAPPLTVFNFRLVRVGTRISRFADRFDDAVLTFITLFSSSTDNPVTLLSRRRNPCDTVAV